MAICFSPPLSLSSLCQVWGAMALQRLSLEAARHNSEWQAPPFLVPHSPSWIQWAFKDHGPAHKDYKQVQEEKNEDIYHYPTRNPTSNPTRNHHSNFIDGERFQEIIKFYKVIELMSLQ